MIKGIVKITVIFLIGICGGLFANQMLWSQYQLVNIPTSIIETKEVTIQENTALQDSITKVEKAIIGVKSQNKKGEPIMGSGLVVTSDGLILTLSDLVPSGGDFVFFVKDETPNWQILKRDARNNLVLVKLETNNLTTVGFSDFDNLKLGERVFLIGITFDKMNRFKEVNEGIVKSFTSEYIKTNINEKSVLSGSALFNIKGELLGLNVINKDINTIPVSTIKEFLGY